MIDYGTGLRTSDFAEQVYRGRQSLCAKGAGSGEHFARDKVPGRLRAAAIAQLRDVSSLSTGYFLTIKAGFMAASLQFSARTKRKETTK